MRWTQPSTVASFYMMFMSQYISQYIVFPLSYLRSSCVNNYSSDWRNYLYYFISFSFLPLDATPPSALDVVIQRTPTRSVASHVSLSPLTSQLHALPGDDVTDDVAIDNMVEKSDVLSRNSQKLRRKTDELISCIFGECNHAKTNHNIAWVFILQLLMSSSNPLTPVSPSPSFLLIFIPPPCPQLVCSCHENSRVHDTRLLHIVAKNPHKSYNAYCLVCNFKLMWTRYLWGICYHIVLPLTSPMLTGNIQAITNWQICSLLARLGSCLENP